MKILPIRPDKPPAHLSVESKRLWKMLNDEWSLDTQSLILLKTALESYDRMTSARELLETEGTVYTIETGFRRPHPALSIEKEAKRLFLQAWRQLSFDVEPPGPVGRPPGT
jgi:P27 family predicted phage terminase small subunit